MAEYRIVAKVDPAGVTQGSAKVKQELRGIDTAATSTKRQLKGTFEAPDLVRSLDNLITRLEGVERQMGDVSRTSAAIASSNVTVTASLDRLAASAGKAAPALTAEEKAARAAARAQTELDAATRRVLQAVDQEAAELARLNALLADARAAHAAGAISTEQFGRVQTMVANGIKQQTVSIQQQRAGYTQLGFQVQDVTQQLALGVNPLVVLAQQGGQTASALQMALGQGGVAGRVATFMAGPWGSLILAATAILGMFAYKALKTGETLDDLVQKQKEDAEQSRRSAEAKEIYARSLEGVRQAVIDQLKEQDKALQTDREIEKQTLKSARAKIEDEIAIRKRTQATLDDVRAQMLADQANRGRPDFNRAFRLQNAPGILRDLESRLAENRSAIENAQQLARNALIPIAEREARIATDPIFAINEQYDVMKTRAIEAARANDRLAASLTNTLTAIENQRNAAIKTRQEQDRAGRRSDGVSRFRTRQQAVGVAGQELQRLGLRVSENEQFWGVQSNHPGMGNKAHGQFAIDVNVGKGITEANVPDLRSRFDELARRYQARGYEVIWNGQFYAAGGNGPTRPAAGHSDHMHIQAPQTIVGKATQGAAEGDYIQTENAQFRAAEQQADFVSQVVDQAATRGINTSTGNVQAQIERVADDFQRRFNRAMTDAERTVVTDALTAAEAREAAAHFEEAYIAPLKRLRDLQGKTGVEREILNTQLSEAARLGRALSESEAQAIRNLYEGQSAEEFNNAFIRPLERLSQLQGQAGLDREVLNAQLEETLRIGRALTQVEAAQIDTSVRRTAALQTEATILADVRDPLEAYRQQIEALNSLLQRGEISQTQFNSRVAGLGGAARQAISDLPGRDPGTGMSYGDIAATADEQARYAQELAMFESNREQLLQMGIDYNALIEAAHRRHVQNMNNIDRARMQTAVAAAQSTSESLLAIAEASMGQQSAIYKAMFVVSKAFAIADAILKIQQGIASALALPFPANLGAIAAVTAAAASIVSNIQAVSLNLADGGYISGPGGGRDDRIPVNASNGEFMVNAEATRKNRALLEAINAGTLTAHTRRSSNDNPALGVASATPRVTINNLAGGVEFEVEPGVTMEEVVITARRVAREESPRAVAADLRDPNSRTRKALQQAGVRGKRH